MIPGSIDTKTEIGRWILEKDNGIDMLKCPKCKCRVIWPQYEIAIGRHGIRYCPYCGENLQPEQLQMYI